jgi:nitrite reductase/ring-hydroxylating ferredoxin subunit
MEVKTEKLTKTAAPAQRKLVRYGGYYTNTVPPYNPELTETGPGTPMGEYMRRFWHPICMSIELTDTPRFLKIMGEELVAFRDKSGRVGVLHAHCVHRGASLEYGIIQERGIMCCYHGFVWDVDGGCLQVPFPKGEEREAEAFAKTICQGAYKAFERSGLVFAYMGPPDEEPPFPEWEGNFTCHPDDELVPLQQRRELQLAASTGQRRRPVSPHAVALHCGGSGTQSGHDVRRSGGDTVRGPAGSAIFPDSRRPRHGVDIVAPRQRRADFHSHQSSGAAQYQLSLVRFRGRREAQALQSCPPCIRWTVPVDDEHCKMMGWRVFGPHIDPRGVGKRELVGFESIDFLEGQVAMRRPERFGKYKLTDLPPIPDNHRERSCYKEAQWAPGDYEAVVSQRRIAVHALETPMKFDWRPLSLSASCCAMRSTAPIAPASPENFRAWLRSVEGAPEYLLQRQHPRSGGSTDDGR